MLQYAVAMQELRNAMRENSIAASEVLFNAGDIGFEMYCSSPPPYSVPRAGPHLRWDSPAPAAGSITLRDHSASPIPSGALQAALRTALRTAVARLGPLHGGHSQWESDRDRCARGGVWIGHGHAERSCVASRACAAAQLLLPACSYGLWSIL